MGLRAAVEVVARAMRVNETTQGKRAEKTPLSARRKRSQKDLGRWNVAVWVVGGQMQGRSDI